MALSPGTRLGPYETVAPLGAGGMQRRRCARATRTCRPDSRRLSRSCWRRTGRGGISRRPTCGWTSRAWQRGTHHASAARHASIVVLPFGNLSPDPENEFFADGLTEEVIADLSAIRALRVISRSSAMRFKGKDRDLAVIARELNVRYVLEGSVRRAGSSLRVTAQLVGAETDSPVWAEKYSGTLEDVFAIQEEISRKIVKALQIKLTESESRAVAERPIDNPAAYDCYLQARHELFLVTPESLDRARTMVDRGLALIGENPLLLATRGMGDAEYEARLLQVKQRWQAFNA